MCTHLRAAGAMIMLTLPAFAQDVGNGRIAFVQADTTGRAQIFTINPDGNDLRQLTDLGANYTSAWSKDGAKIAFTSNRTETAELWIMDADGANQTQITLNTPGINFVPDWSHDGQRIAFASLRQGVAHAEVWVMDANGSNAERLTFTPTNPKGFTWSLHPSWSADGRIVYASTVSGSTEVWIMNNDGSNQVQVTDNSDAAYPDSNVPEWSRDGNKITFWSGFEGQFGEVWVMDADGTNRVRLTKTPDPLSSDGPAWSPDASKIVFATNRTGSFELWMMDENAANQHVLLAPIPAPGAIGLGQTSWQPVAPPPVPAVMGWNLLVMSLFVLTAGTIVLRHRNKCPAERPAFQR